ncbi:nicotinamide riboside transporter PnuC [Priestia megaterium]|uniref:nicotinamide riboside transporter PnuC n=1 Tax=Priestia megaterium TaxID=1404 RepID=UPI002E20DE2B|nr:nicotinamide riboside transporter PnuC [Priestia megaterium]MED3976136.1 nicotinamide riboside transporter PnuC [Priestia megaterium]
MLKDWTKFEKVWLALFAVVNIYLFFALHDTIIGLVSSLSGMICVVLVAKGKMSNYYFGIVQTATYAYISYTYGLFGEAMIYGIVYLPMQFIGIYLWSKNNKKKEVESTKGEDVEVKRLSIKGMALLLLVTALLSLGYAEVLKLIGGQQVRIDSVAVVVSVMANILMLKRYAEQWFLWIIVNVLSITLWIITLVNSDGNSWSMLIMYSAFFVNSLYGYINWIKMSKKQEAK